MNENNTCTNVDGEEDMVLDGKDIGELADGKYMFHLKSKDKQGLIPKVKILASTSLWFKDSTLKELSKILKEYRKWGRMRNKQLKVESTILVVYYYCLTITPQWPTLLLAHSQASPKFYNNWNQTQG